MTAVMDSVPAPVATPRSEPEPPARVRLADGQVFDGPMPASKHRSLHLGMLHSESVGFVELTPGTRPPGGKVELDRRKRPEHFLPGGQSSDQRWFERLLYHAERIVDGAYARQRFDGEAREECFVGVAPRNAKGGGREHVSESRWLWIDVDDRAQLERLYAFLAERPCHLLIESAGSGGCHAYWQLAESLPAVRVDERTGELIEPIERANGRLVQRLGADRQCRDRARVLRLAGTPNHKTGQWARIVQADLALSPYTVAELVGDLLDPEPERFARVSGLARGNDPYRLIPAVDYMTRLTGQKANREGKVRCPTPGHQDAHPSCSVAGPHPECWQCQSCGAAGTIYDLASICLGGPYGRGALKDADFRRARALVESVYRQHPSARAKWAATTEVADASAHASSR